ncbi:hypothetical protein F5Y10DRAFT_235518 [Nemania abortiva]|nr:hypothetical protein F5Y10DRAFT_235518 [Nemania abortiva]
MSSQHSYLPQRLTHMRMPERPYVKHRAGHLSPVQADLVAATGEFVGTFWFLFFAYSGQLMAVYETKRAGITAGPSLYIYASLSYGFSLLVTVWAMYRISGGFFNPAVCRPIHCSLSRHSVITRNAKHIHLLVTLLINMSPSGGSARSLLV